MRIALPPTSQRLALARALKTLALADGVLHPQERRMIERALETLDVAEEIDDLEEITPEALAAELTDPAARESLMRCLVLLSTLDAEVSEAEVSLLEAYGAALSVDERAVHNLRQLVQGHVRRMAFDLSRRSFAPNKLKRIWTDEGLDGLWKLAKAALGVVDRKLSTRFEALGRLPEDTLGRALYEHFIANGFPYPGKRHGVPENMLFHDIGHVLSGYDTDPAGELQVAGFQAGYLAEDGLVMMLMIVMLFQLGVEPIAKMRGVPAHKGMLDVDRFYESYERGRALHQNLLDWDPWPHMERPLADVRAELNVLPRTESADPSATPR